MKTMKIMKTMRILVLSSLVLMFACKPDLRVPEGYDEYGNRLVRRVTEIYSGVCHPIDFYYDEQGRIVTVTDSYTHSNWGFLAWNEYAFERSGGNLEIKGHWKAKVSDGWHWKAKGYSFLQKIPIGSFSPKDSLRIWDTTLVEARCRLNADGTISELANYVGQTFSYGYMDGLLEEERGAKEGVEEGARQYVWKGGDLVGLESTLLPRGRFEVSYGLDTNRTNLNITALLDAAADRNNMGLTSSCYEGLFPYKGEKPVHLPLAFTDDFLSFGRTTYYSYVFDSEGLPVEIEERDAEGRWQRTWEFEY